MNYYNLEKSWSICVSKCPDRQLNNAREVYDYYDEAQLCDYSIPHSKYEEKTHCKLDLLDCYGPCPALEVPEE